jgi:inner membrane protein
MMFKTHLAFGLLVGLFVSEYFDISQKVLFVTICTLAAILPDLDIPMSKIGGLLKPLSWLLNLLFGHRGLLHSIWFPLLIYFIFRAFDKELWAGAFFLGYMSHLVMDMLTIKGVYFFYPLNRVRVNGFVKTGGILEWIVFVLIVVGVVFVVI